MEKGWMETFSVRVVSVGFAILALAIFKPFGLDNWLWEAYVHLLLIWILGIGVCMITEVILKFIVRKPRSYKHGVSYIIHRNLWFQMINTPLVTLMICLYRHFVLSDRLESNRLSWSNFFETLFIMAFCSFAIGLYWRYKYRSRYLAAELEETRLLNEQLQKLQRESLQVNKNTKEMEDHEDKALENSVSNTPHQANAFTNTSEQSQMITLTGATSDTVCLQISQLLYVEAVGNYVKVYQWREGKVHSEMLRATSRQIEEKLQIYPMIVRCHRAFIVNLVQVEKIVSRAGRMQLIMKHSNDSIPVSRSNMASIKETVKRVSQG